MKSFNSKILLFGEYVVLNNAMGLAVPYSFYYGRLKIPDNDTILNREQLKSNSVLKKLAIELSHLEPFASNFNINDFLEDALLGLYFNSNIPKSYGVGSSGSLVAAIFNKYFSAIAKPDFDKPESLIKLRIHLAKIESFFHGKSSGIDPLVSYLDKPVLINAPANHFKFHIPKNLKVFLIDSNKSSSTKDFIEIYQERMKTEPNTHAELAKLNNKVITSFLTFESNIFEDISDFCKLEQKFLPEMFENYHGIMQFANSCTKDFCVKLCGSGGGGFLLGFTKNNSFERVKKDLKKKGYDISLVITDSNDLINL